jgi:hypothetical protein
MLLWLLLLLWPSKTQQAGILDMSTEAFAAATQLFAMATRANIETAHKLYYEKYY